ncbi:MAG: bifunctional diguanylate cyclase/phosphodiesterase [Rubrivivax sp.]|nr:bifunctional diguanylate cyclase/phosphodiesterase [Rubrivivax sp.]
MGSLAADVSSLVRADLLAWSLGACVGLLVLLALEHWRVVRSRQHLAKRLQAANSQLEDLRGRDVLTGLMTRADFERSLDEAVLACNRDGASLAVLYVGLDNFRSLNEAYGHTVGDAVLAQAADRLRTALGVQLALARLGGDEYVLLLAATDDEAADAAEQLLRELHRPYGVDALSLRLGASVGIAIYPDHGARPRLLGCAAVAMRSVKQLGGGGHAFYDPALAVDERDKAELLQALRRAVEQGQLQLVYQPKVDAQSLQITAAEALLRWEHPQRGTIGPAVFVPLAERHGLMGPIGHWVINEACRQAAQWRGLGLRMRVAVNISGHQMRQDDLVQHIAAALQRHGIPAGRLTCEITESVAMEDTAHTRATFERLRQLGVHVSIDDFGTGHSSLASLRRLPAAELKIDRAFVTDLGQSERARSIGKALVDVARTLDLRVVAEGVETTEQRDVLVALGCDELQGYLFARPMTATALALWAERDEPHDGAPSDFRASLFDPTATMPLD